VESAWKVESRGKRLLLGRLSHRVSLRAHLQADEFAFQFRKVFQGRPQEGVRRPPPSRAHRDVAQFSLALGGDDSVNDTLDVARRAL